jgi:hypothetical protein
MKKNLALILLLLTGLAFADMTCIYDPNPNLGSNLNINCGSQVSVSNCKATVFVTNTTIMIGEYPQYPTYFFQEDRKPYYTFADGSFMFTVFMDDKTFFRDTNYSINVTCFNPTDNSTNSTLITFSPFIQSPPEFLSSYILWATQNAGLLFVYFVLLMVVILFLLWAYAMIQRIRHGG